MFKGKQSQIYLRKIILMIPLLGELGELIEVLVILALKARRLLSNSCRVCYYGFSFYLGEQKRRKLHLLQCRSLHVEHSWQQTEFCCAVLFQDKMKSKRHFSN